MGQIRIGFQRVPAGSAARQAEDESKGLAPTPSRRIVAGSAARLTEDEKRSAQQHMGGAVGFSLRAQAGRVVRTDEQFAAQRLPCSPSPLPKNSQATPALPQTSHAAPLTRRATQVATDVAPPRASPSPPGTGRLQSFLRGFFLPDKPANP